MRRGGPIVNRSVEYADPRTAPGGAPLSRAKYNKIK
jgi:hypothetical protein